MMLSKYIHGNTKIIIVGNDEDVERVKSMAEMNNELGGVELSKFVSYLIYKRVYAFAIGKGGLSNVKASLINRKMKSAGLYMKDNMYTAAMFLLETDKMCKLLEMKEPQRTMLFKSSRILWLKAGVEFNSEEFA